MDRTRADASNWIIRRQLRRRDLLLGSAGAAAGMVFATGRSLATPLGKVDADPDEAGLRGVDLLQSWFRGELRGPLPPGSDWAPFVSQVGKYAFSYPPEWQVTESTDPTPNDYRDGFATTTAIAAPDNSATLYVYDVALLPINVTSREFAWTTIQTLAGEAKVEQLAEDYQELQQGMNGAAVAGRVGDEVVAMQAYGSTFIDRSGLNSFVTSFSSTIEFANADDFDQLTDEVFMPLLFNFQRMSGGGGETPTPEPEYS
jgi:hypothetical protein